MNLFLPSVKCSEDFFDECVMEQVRYGLIQLNAQTGLDISGTQSTITFHSKVMTILFYFQIKIISYLLVLT